LERRALGSKAGTRVAKRRGMFLLTIPAFCITAVILLAFVVHEAR
jgi:hypothetical protein